MRLLTRTAMAAAMFASVGMLSVSPAEATISTTGPLPGTVTVGPGGATCLTGATSCNASANGGGYNFKFTLPAFTSSYGTLQSITVSLATTLTGDATITDTTNNAIPFSTINLQNTGFQALLPSPASVSPYNPFSSSLTGINLSGLNASPAISLYNAGITSLTVPANTSICYASDGAGGCTVNNSLKAIANTSVVDSAVADLTAALSGFTISGSVIGFQNQSSSSGITYNANVFSQEQVSVTYTYVQACGLGLGQTGVACPTPEPASLTLIGSGLLGLAAIVRRRRKTG